MFEGFEQRRIETSGTTINLVIGGSGPPLLLLHGYPQTHVMWHKIAPMLAEDFTVVIPDLRGYGDSGKPHGDPKHANYSKRAMALDQVEVMQALGHQELLLVGHDRGARVSHRLTKDHPQRVLKLMTLTNTTIPFDLPEEGVKIAVKVIDQYGLEHMTVIDDPRAMLGETQPSPKIRPPRSRKRN